LSDEATGFTGRAGFGQRHSQVVDRLVHEFVVVEERGKPRLAAFFNNYELMHKTVHHLDMALSVRPLQNNPAPISVQDLYNI
jgi:hypothetical protein